MADWLTFGDANGTYLGFGAAPQPVRDAYMVFWRNAFQDQAADVLTKLLNGRTGTQTAGSIRTASNRIGRSRSANAWTNPTAGDAGYVLQLVANIRDAHPNATFRVFP